MEIIIHLRWEGVPMHGGEELKQATLDAIRENVPEEVRDLWTDFPTPQDSLEMDEHSIAQAVFESAVSHLNRKRDDEAFGLSESPADAGVTYIYNDNIVTCVYSAPLLFEGQEWVVEDPTGDNDPAQIRMQVMMSAGAEMPEGQLEVAREADPSSKKGD